LMRISGMVHPNTYYCALMIFNVVGRRTQSHARTLREGMRARMRISFLVESVQQRIADDDQGGHPD
jgi:hypothetical protein